MSPLICLTGCHMTEIIRLFKIVSENVNELCMRCEITLLSTNMESEVMKHKIKFTTLFT